MIADKFLTVKEASEIINVSQAAIYRIINQDEYFPAIKVGGSIRIPEEELEKYLYSKIKGW